MATIGSTVRAKQSRAALTGTVRCLIVVPAWNALHYLRKTVPAMRRAAKKHGNAQIVIVDNGSSDGTAGYIRSVYPDVTVISLPRQPIGAARNKGAQSIKSEILAFIDADCLMDEDHLVAADRLLSNEGVSVTGDSYDIPAKPGWIERTWYHLHRPAADGVTRLIPAGNLVVARKAFEEVGGFDEELITGEDADLCQRLIRAGYHPFASHAIRVVHLGNPKTLRAFFSMNVWHSIGMFGSARSNWLDRPILMMFGHLTITILALATMLNTSINFGTRLTILLASQIVAPTLSVSYRMVYEGGGITWANALPNVTRAILLYWVYYWARVRALCLLILGRANGYTKRG